MKTRLRSSTVQVVGVPPAAPRLTVDQITAMLSLDARRIEPRPHYWHRWYLLRSMCRDGHSPEARLAQLMFPSITDAVIMATRPGAAPIHLKSE